MSNKQKIGRVGVIAALIVAALNGFQPSYETELLLWGSCIIFSLDI